MNRAQRRLAERRAAENAAANHPQLETDGHRAEINRRNARASTGPITGAGKETSKMNALKHGLTAQNPVIPSENQSAYETHKATWLAELKPVTFAEMRLAQIVLDTQWRLNRILGIEDKLAAEELDAIKLIKALDNLSRHESRLSKALDKALRELFSLKEIRRQAERNSKQQSGSRQDDNSAARVPGFVLQKLENMTAEPYGSTSNDSMDEEISGEFIAIEDPKAA